MTKGFTTHPASAGVPKKRSGLRLLGSALMPLLLTGGVALAQEQEGSAMEDELEGVEEIVVTTRRRAESLQDVPVSVTAFNAEQIEQVKPSTLRDFDGLAPNLYVGMNTAGPSASALYIRGVGYADIEKTQTPQVGVIVDGVQMGTSTGQLIDVFDVESIEVNRGPQGVLFGKNTTGGNIVVNRVRPQFDEFGLKARFALGNHESRQYQARANVPMVEDRLALKLGANWRDRNGYYDNPTLGGTSGNIDFESQTASLRLKATERFDATLTYDRIHDRSQTLPQDALFDGNSRFISLSGKREPTRYEVDLLGLRIDWDITDRLGLHAVTGLSDGLDHVTQDFDGIATRVHLAAPFAQLHTQRNQEFEVFTQELRFTYDLSDSLDFMLGAYYYDSELNFTQHTNNVLQLPPALAVADFMSAAEEAGNWPPETCEAANEIALDVPPPIGPVTLNLRPHPLVGDVFCQFPNARSVQRASEQVEALSFFGAVNWRPTEDLEFSVGVRAIDEEKTLSNSYFDYSNSTFDDGGMGGFDHSNEFDFSAYQANERVGTAYSGGDSWDDVILTASASWQLSDTIRTYINYSEGFRSGGLSIRSARVPTKPASDTEDDTPAKQSARAAEESAFEPEEAWQLEFGMKGEFLQRRLRLNLAFFLLQTDGGQFSSIITLPPGSIPGTTTIINNADKTEIQGAELEARWLLNDYFTILLNGGFIDVENKPYTAACDVIDGCADGAPSGTLRQRGGNDDNRQPDSNYSASLLFARQLSGGELDASLTYKKAGDFLLANTGAIASAYEGDYYGVDAHVSYQWQRGDSTWTLAAFGKNLTDEEWKEQLLFLGGATAGFQGWGAPRTYSVELTYEF